MSIISKFNYYGEDKRDWKGKPISNINYKGQDYHFAERNVVTDGVCVNAVEEPLYDMRISGNSVQETYTGKNLFDISKTENGTLDSGNGTDLSVENYPNRCRSNFIYLNAGSYVISFKELISTGNYLHTYSSNNQSSWIGSLYFSKSGSVSKFTLTTACYVRFTIQSIDTSSDLVLNTETLKQYEPQLEQGTNSTSYEPYVGGTTSPNPDYPQEVKSVGDKTSNLADLSKAQLSTTTPNTIFEYNNLTGTIELKSTPRTYDYSYISAENLGLEVGKTYYYGGDVIVSGKQTTATTNMVFSLADTTYKGFYVDKNGTTHIQGTFTYTGQSSVSFRMFFNYGSAEPANVTFANVYVSEVKDEFEPYGYKMPIKINDKVTNIYLNEPLRKAGDYIDYIDYKNKKVVRPMTRLIFNGTETFWTNQTVSNNQVVSVLKTSINTGGLVLPYTSNKFYCSHFNISTIINTVNIGQVYCGGNYINFNLDGVNNLTTFKEWLAQQYANGTPVVFEYPVATPTEETIEIPDIQMTKGTNIFGVQTEIQPSALSVEYWKQI